MKIVAGIILLSSCATYAQEDFFSLDSYGTQVEKPITAPIENQDQEDSTSYNAFKEHVPYWRMEKNFKLTPFDAFSAVPTLGIDLETKMSSLVSFQYGVGIIPSFLQVQVGTDQGQYNWMNGYRVRFESRFLGFKNPDFYTSSEISFRHLIINSETSIGMEGDGSGNFAYFILQDMLYHRFSTHLNLKVGWQKVLSSRMVVDFYLGFSLRRNNVASNTSIPEGGVVQGQGWWNLLQWRLEDGHDYGYAIPIAGFRIGWNIPAKADL